MGTLDLFPTAEVVLFANIEAPLSWYRMNSNCIIVTNEACSGVGSGFNV
jgi:hypothetical protein